MARLPQPGGDSGNWGDILNDYLSQSHKPDGTIKDDVVTAAAIADGVIAEQLLSAGVQSKLNTSSPNATSTTLGVVQLAGDLGGSASNPTVPALSNKLDTSTATNTYAKLHPDAYFDATTSPNGTPTALTSGQPITLFGNSPLAVASGALVHTPGSGANQAGYMQANLNAPVVGIGAEMQFTASSTGAIALVIPSVSWGPSVGYPAGVHFVIYGSGSWHVSYWTGSSESMYASGNCSAMQDGLTRKIELLIDVASSTLNIYFPDGTTSKITDTRIAANISTFAVWELYEQTGSGAIPAKIISAWARLNQVAAPNQTATLGDIARAVGSIPASSTFIRYEYTSSSSSVAVPANAKGAYVTLIAAGGGGGSGRRGAAGTIRAGGGAGGSGGFINDQWIPQSLLGATFIVTLGAAGAGGTNITSNDTNGNNGTSAQGSSFTSGGNVLRAIGGGYGGGGTATGATNAGAGAPNATSGASPSATGGAGNAGALVTANLGAAGGGSGGGITTADAASTGGTGGAAFLWGNNIGGAGGVVNSTLPGSGSAAVAGRPGDGAGGGASSIIAAAQSGASALGYGAGGGGGGASLNGFTSGAGGSGGPAYARITFVI